MDYDLIKKIRKARVVSFDIYDTLIVRACERPQSVFEIIESFGYNQFADKRIKAEKKARRNTEDEEITLDDIYTYLGDSENNVTLKNEEKRIEEEISRTNMEMLEVFNYCISEKKKVIITSDMYLPVETITRILEKNGFTRYSRLFLSSEEKLRKKTGHLFSYIIKQLNIQPGELLHIGDNHYSDNTIPMGIGIKTYEYHRNKNTLAIHPKRRCSFPLIKLRCVENADSYFQIGYEALGPLLYGFSVWLHKKIMHANYDRIVFLSRDGQVMKQAYELLFGESEKTQYLYGSRRSLIVPILWKNPEIEYVKDIIHFHDRMSINEFLERIGLDSSQCHNQLSFHGYSGDSLINICQFTDDKAFLSFYETIKPLIIEQSKKEYQSAYNYWAHNIDGASKIAIVDIGWNGNMQNALLNLLQNQVEINGYYIGVNPKTKHTFHMNGFLFDKSSDTVLKGKIDNFSGLFESFFMADHGSVKRYTKDGVELLPYEYSLLDGKIVDEDQCIRKIQCGALHYIKDIISIIGDNEVVFSSDDSICNMLSLGLNPSNEACNLFGDFRFYNSGISYLARPQNKRFSLQELKQTNWRIGYLKRCFHVHLPYYQVARAIKLLKKLSKQ